MGTRTLTLELPEEIVALLGSAETAAAKAREMVVLELLRQARIGQSLAAEVLGVTRWDILELMQRYQISSGPRTEEELRREVEGLRRYSEKDRLDAGGQ